MKKLSLVIIACFMVTGCAIKLDLRDASREQRTTQKIIEVEGLSQAEVYNLVRQWFVDRSINDSIVILGEPVGDVDYADKQAGTVINNSRTRLYLQASVPTLNIDKPSSYANYHIRVDTKDGMARITTYVTGFDFGLSYSEGELERANEILSVYADLIKEYIQRNRWK